MDSHCVAPPPPPPSGEEYRHPYVMGWAGLDWLMSVIVACNGDVVVGERGRPSWVIVELARRPGEAAHQVDRGLLYATFVVSTGLFYCVICGSFFAATGGAVTLRGGEAADAQTLGEELASQRLD